MPVTPTYPGLYIEELQSSAHTITAAPTSVTVFVGYTHPFKTAKFNQPTEIFSFSDYERLFGGFFNSSLFAADQAAGFFGDVAMAVYQFFQNGGADAFVVGLKANLPAGSSPPSPLDDLNPITGQATATIQNANFEALEFVDDLYQMTITVESVDQSQVPPTADLTISYLPTKANTSTGARVATETYPRLNFELPGDSDPNSIVTNPNSIVTRISGVSQLVDVALDPAKPAPSAATVWQQTPFTVQLAPALSAPAALPQALGMPSIGQGHVFEPLDFTTALQADSPLDKLPIFNLLVLPGVTDSSVLSAASAFCQLKRAFLIMDPPPGGSPDGTTGTPIVTAFGSMPKSKNSALYFPYLQSNDPTTGQVINIPPSGTVAGIFSEIDQNRGVWKAPAGLETLLTNVTNVIQPSGIMTDQRQGVLNQAGINCIRNFTGVGPVVFGARTSVSANPSFQQWKYVPVRRMALFLEQTLYASLGWVVFEPNDEPLWNAIKSSIESFMLGLFRQGAFQGDSPSDAFQVKCDKQTTTQDDINNGIVNIVVAFAPLKPAEFVIIQIAQLAGQAQT
jgi:uncharacterized protein